ncbi:Protein OXIDATIVE STRESS 3 LIKE 2 [Cardamine amara subsp. amara]|uniref:Protein OXIDATIVE STRESS 3 LIKE 2 n=1 Tax=Cardamine amara subsp. amara TaxID=228776 RepID=A0ABD0Z1R5_CARAN
MGIVMDETDYGDVRTFSVVEKGAGASSGGCWSSSSSSSASIWKNSDDENEVESSNKGPLDMMESLEEVLPIRRGISNFYKGRSKSFMSLSEAASLPIKDLAKPENSHTRRRRNLFSHRMYSRGGILKKPVKSALTIAVTSMSQREGDSSSSSDDDSPPRQLHLNLPPRQSKGSFGNCVPVVDSPRCFKSATGSNIHNIIC